MKPAAFRRFALAVLAAATISHGANAGTFPSPGAYWTVDQAGLSMPQVYAPTAQAVCDLVLPYWLVYAPGPWTMWYQEDWNRCLAMPPPNQGVPAHVANPGVVGTCASGQVVDVDTGTCQAAVISDEKSCTARDVTSDPIRLATGTKILEETDFADSAPHPLNMVRHYASIWGARPHAGFGLTWSHAHSHRIDPVDASTMAVVLGDGSMARFTQAGIGAWQSAGNSDYLLESAQGWTYQRAKDDGVWFFDKTSGRLLWQRDRQGRNYTYTYTAGRLSSVTNAFGRSLAFTYDGFGKLLTATAPDGSVITYQYDAGSRLGTVVHPGGATKKYLYEDVRFPQALTGRLDEKGARVNNVQYDTVGRAVLSELNSGLNRTTVSYGPASTVVTDPKGATRTLQYIQATGRASGPRSVSASGLPPDGDRVATQAFDSESLLASQTDFLGITTQFAWDAARRLPTSRTEAAGLPESRTTQTQWHPTLRLPVLVTVPGRSTAYTYDAGGSVLSTTVTDTATGFSRTRSMTYTPEGLLNSLSDEGGGQWLFSYDAAGNRVSETNPLGHQATSTYDAAGRVLSRAEPTGLVTSYAYDSRGRLTSKTRGSESTSIAYQATGRIDSVTHSSGRVITFSYDAVQRPTGWQDNRGAQATYTLDAAGNVTLEQLHGAGNQLVLQQSSTVNSLNQLTARSTGSEPSGYVYDANGRRISETNALNQSTALGLDGLGRATTVTDPAGAIASLAYNQLDELTAASDFKSVPTVLARNGFGETTAESGPDAGVRAYTYDALGRVQTATDAKGQTTVYARDQIGRPRRIVHADGSSSDLEYDQPGDDYNAPGSPNASVGRLSFVVDPTGSTHWQRDAHGRVTKKTQFLINGSSQSVQYVYNAKGLLDTLTYQSGAVLQYAYSSAGELVSVARNGTPLLSGIQWNAAGQPTAWTWAFATPVAAHRTYNTAGRLTKSEIAEFDWNAAGRITAIRQALMTPSQSGPVSATATFQVGYDAVGRVTSFNELNGASTSFSYDPNGNRTGSAWTFGTDQETRTYTVDAASNRLLGFTASASGAGGTATAVVSYAYSPNGEIVEHGPRKFGYDARGRLAMSAVGDGSVSGITKYAHNTMGQRVFKTEPLFPPAEPQEQSWWDKVLGLLQGWWAPQQAQAEHLGWAYVYDEEGTLLAETGMGGPASAGLVEYIWLPTPSGPMPVAAVINGTTYAVHADHLNTPRRLTDGSGAVAWQWKFDAFGEEPPTIASHGFIATAAQPGDLTFNLRYPGQYADAESGLHYNYFRSYDASDGRYTQVDLIGLDGGWNRFAYAKLSPLRHTDPTGLFTGPKHATITAKALLRMPVNCPDLGLGVVMADFRPAGAQDPRNAHWHAMSDGTNPNDTPEAAAKRFGAFLEDQMTACSCGALARALHAAQDSYAGGHRNFQPWSGGNSLGLPSAEHLRADQFPSPAAEEGAVRESVELLKRFKASCECRR